MKKCNSKNDDLFYEAGGAAVGQAITQASDIVLGAISQNQQATFDRQAASRQFGFQQAGLDSQIRLAEQEARSLSVMNTLAESRKQSASKTIQKIALVAGIFAVIGVGIYYASKKQR